MNEMKKRTERKLAAVLALAGMTGFLTAGSAKATSAYLSSKEAAENRAGFADNRIVIEEPDFNPDTKTDYGTTVYPKRVNLKNTGNVPVYARVKIVFSDPAAEACTSFTNSQGTFPASQLKDHLPSGWVIDAAEGADGFFYCTTPLAPGETSPDLIRSAATVFREESGRMDYDIYVRAESVQTKRDTGSGMHELTWQEAWKGAAG